MWHEVSCCWVPSHLQQFRQLGGDPAEVAEAGAGGEPALERQAVARPRVDGQVNALPVVVDVAEVAGERVVVVQLAEPRSLSSGYETFCPLFGGWRWSAP